MILRHFAYIVIILISFTADSLVWFSWIEDLGTSIRDVLALFPVFRFGLFFFLFRSHSFRSLRVFLDIGFFRSTAIHCIYRARARNFTAKRLDSGFIPHGVARYQVYLLRARGGSTFVLKVYFDSGYLELSKRWQESQGICPETCSESCSLYVWVTLKCCFCGKSIQRYRCSVARNYFSQSEASII